MWETQVAQLDVLDREGTIYLLSSDAKAYPTKVPDLSDQEREVLDHFCDPDDWYIRFNSSQCSAMGVASELYLSVKFLNSHVKPGNDSVYEWHVYREVEDKAQTLVDGTLVRQLPFGLWKDLVNSASVKFDDRVALRGGYQLPARDLEGVANLFVLSSTFKNMASARHWESAFRAATSISALSGAAFASANDMVIYGGSLWTATWSNRKLPGPLSRYPKAGYLKPAPPSGLRW
jgi:hypothetical protein